MKKKKEKKTFVGSILSKLAISAMIPVGAVVLLSVKEALRNSEMEEPEEKDFEREVVSGGLDFDIIKEVLPFAEEAEVHDALCDLGASMRGISNLTEVEKSWNEKPYIMELKEMYMPLMLEVVSYLDEEKSNEEIREEIKRLLPVAVNAFVNIESGICEGDEEWIQDNLDQIKMLLD